MKLVVLLLVSVFAFASGNVSLRSVAIKGALVCGTNPAENVHVRLLRTFVNPKTKEEEGKYATVICKLILFSVAKEVLDSRLTGPSGQFEVNGNNNGRALNETTIEPSLAIYHQCDDAKDTVSRYSEMPSFI